MTTMHVRFASTALLALFTLCCMTACQSGDASREKDAGRVSDGGRTGDPGRGKDAGRDAGRTVGVAGRSGGASDASQSLDAADGLDAGGDEDGSTACAGSVASCSVASTCPASGNVCVARTCNAHCCGFQDLPDGTAISAQTAGDCQSVVCNGAGATTTVAASGDVADDHNPCTADQCNGTTPTHTSQAGSCTLASKPAVCGDVAGTAAGTCIGCNLTADCTGGKECVTQSCVTPTCADGMQNGYETAIDCGGTGYWGAGACPTCPDDAGCTQNSDCTNTFCNTSLTPAVCKTPTCSDAHRNGQETGVDCGGAACNGVGKTCAVGSQCNYAPDCTSGYCNNNLCALKPQSLYCAANSECLSGHCVDGVCCDKGCNGTCEACSNAKKGAGADGVCAAVIAGTDPHNTCAQTAAAGCGTDGWCAAGGVCELWSSSTVCSPGHNCDGQGTCL
jgi:hypothetical protein